MTPQPFEDTGAVLAELARSLGSDPAPLGVQQRVADAAVAEIEGARWAGITQLSRSGAFTPVATADVVRRVAQAQFDTGEGPCLAAATDPPPIVMSNDLAADTRWPRFAAVALSYGVRAALAFQLYTDSDTIGSLTVYADQAEAFTPASQHLGGLLAAHAALAIRATNTEANLRFGLETRDVIGQAKGILMERFKISDIDAFDLLAAASQQTQRKIREIAGHLARTGELG